MSNSRKQRVKRGPPPKKPIKRRNPASCLPELLRDFEERCAYSMQHTCRAGKLEVDHFDPRRKKDLIQNYNNLFPASRHCNGKKSDTWPNKAERAAGCRFLNPCEEMDYGEQIFEDPVTHRLLGTTPAAVWHIRVCGLNADQLVAERKRRADHWKTLNKLGVHRLKGSRRDRTPLDARIRHVADMITQFREEVALMIPEISPPPGSAAA